MHPSGKDAKGPPIIVSDHFEQRFRVGWSGLDANHHMGNTSYLDRAHDTRMLFFAQQGFTMSRFAAERFGPVVVRDELVYRKELRLLDEFTVDFELAGLSAEGVRFRVRNTFRNVANEVAAAVTSEGVWFDLASSPSSSASGPRPPDARPETHQGLHGNPVQELLGN